jgi:hypothetical protein
MLMLGDMTTDFVTDALEAAASSFVFQNVDSR